MRVRGTIVTDYGDMPLTGANLYTNGLFGKKLLGTTDRNGEFNISASDVAGFQIAIEKPGYLPVLADPGALDESVTQLQAGGAVVELPNWARIAFAGFGVWVLIKLL
jgi:hypothetical protein